MRCRFQTPPVAELLSAFEREEEKIGPVILLALQKERIQPIITSSLQNNNSNELKVMAEDLGALLAFPNRAKPFKLYFKISTIEAKLKDIENKIANMLLAVMMATHTRLGTESGLSMILEQGVLHMIICSL